ncbi:MAG: cytochrome c [Planctomycetes bacterium]|nr:cytochrome c [Planctomycetota bacterium]
MSPFKVAIALLAGALSLGGCMRGGVSELPPVHLVLDMDFQPKLKAQSKTEFEGWTDGRGSRLPVRDPVSTDPLGKTLVVARGSLPNAALAHKDAAGAFVKSNPLPLTHKFTVLGREVATIDRGKERFEIHCAICHGYSGQGGNGAAGHGLVGKRWPVLIPNFHFVDGKDNRVANLTDGELFDVITYGKNTMPSYGARLSVEDRWAIVHYVRALQSLSK